jgi:hypothetical protein
MILKLINNLLSVGKKTKKEEPKKSAKTTTKTVVKKAAHGKKSCSGF